MLLQHGAHLLFKDNLLSITDWLPQDKSLRRAHTQNAEPPKCTVSCDTDQDLGGLI